MGVTQTIVDVLSLAILGIAEDAGGVVTVALMSANRITGLITPFIYQSNYNGALKSALRHNSYSYSIDPLIVPKDGGAPTVGLAFNLRY